MLDDMVQEVWADLTERRGEELRAVILYNGEQSAIELRQDLRESYPRAKISRILEDAIFSSIDKPHQESLFTTGELQYVVRTFENAYIGHYIIDDYSGMLISLQPEDLDLSDLEADIRFIKHEHPLNGLSELSP